MRTYDFSPLFRSTIGFDRLFDLAETAQRATDEGYPPYNIERLAEDRYQITLAVAGFSPDQLEVTVEDRQLTVQGKRLIEKAVPAWEEAQRQATELLGDEGIALLDKAAKKLRQAKAEG